MRTIFSVSKTILIANSIGVKDLKSFFVRKTQARRCNTDQKKYGFLVQSWRGSSESNLILKEDDLETLPDSATFWVLIIQQKELLMLENIKERKEQFQAKLRDWNGASRRDYYWKNVRFLGTNIYGIAKKRCHEI